MNPALVAAWSQTLGGTAPDDDIDLAACALVIAELETADVDAPRYLARLDELAAGARAGAAPGEPLLDAVVRHLFVDRGFRGNDEAYYDPRNSCLDQVLERRLGIPITLSVVLLEVGWRLGLDLAGVGFPGHFLVRARSVAGEQILDPFGGGQALGRSDLERLLERALGPGTDLEPEHLRAASKREILARMLNNLVGIYRGAGDEARAREARKLLDVTSAGSVPAPPGRPSS